jgi:hypothetical protein
VAETIIKSMKQKYQVGQTVSYETLSYVSNESLSYSECEGWQNANGSEFRTSTIVGINKYGAYQMENGDTVYESDIC